MGGAERIDRLISHLNYRWKLHKELFQNPAPFELYKQAGVNVWHTFEDVLLDSIFLDIARLLDPEQTGKKQNLTLSRLIKHSVDSEYPEVLGTNLDQAYVLYTELIAPWRNRVLSHNDYLTLVKKKSLPVVPYDSIEAIVSSINEVGRYISLSATDIDRVFSPGVTSKAWVPRLFKVLRAGIQAINKENNDAQSGLRE